MQKYSTLIKGVDYTQLQTKINYLIYNQATISDFQKELQLHCEDEFDEFKDIQVPRAFTAQNMKDRMLINYKILNDEEIDELILKQNIEFKD